MPSDPGTSVSLCFSCSIRAAVDFSPFLPRSGPGPLPLHCPTIEVRFVGYSARDEGPGSKVAPLLFGDVVSRKN